MRPLPVIDRNLLVAVSGGLTSDVRARPAQKDPIKPSLPGATFGGGQSAAPAVGKPGIALPADPLATMISQLGQTPGR